MTLSPFSWIRRKAAEAVVLGTSDGLRAITPEGEMPPTDLADLRQLLANATIEPKALTAAAKDDAEPAPEPEPAATAAKRKAK